MNRSRSHRRYGRVLGLAAALLSVPGCIAAQDSEARAARLMPGLLPSQQSDTPPQPGRTEQPNDVQPTQAQQPALPNTMSAPAFTVADKFDYRVVQSFGARGLLGAALGAAIGQARNSPHEWGQGFEGFADRYGSGFAGNLSRQTFAFVLDTAFKEDPRYFPSTDKGFKRRSWNAIKQAIFCKTDDGRDSVAYSRLFSTFGSGQFTNVWQPASTGSVMDGITRAIIGIGGDAGYNWLQEFLPFMRPHSFRHHHP